MKRPLSCFLFSLQISLTKPVQSRALFHGCSPFHWGTSWSEREFVFLQVLEKSASIWQGSRRTLGVLSSSVMKASTRVIGGYTPIASRQRLYVGHVSVVFATSSWSSTERNLQPQVRLNTTRPLSHVGDYDLGLCGISMSGIRYFIAEQY